MKQIALVGCTGSIGRQVAEVVRTNPAQFCFSALANARDGTGLAALEEEFHPSKAICGGEADASFFEDCDVAFIAAGGFSGLRWTLAAIEAGKTVALANKESLVCGGELVTAAAKARGVEIVPVDSEHSALFQALSFHRDTPFERLILTASGGPFLHLSKEELATVTAEDALRHPTWKMGKKVTIDSATLLNKGYEIIEAKWLYGADYAQIGAVIHPESVVHAAVAFEDGSLIAQLAYPDMRLPIQLALTYPDRMPCLPTLELSKLGTLHFGPIPEEKFPCFSLALSAGKRGGTAPAVLNGAAEIAVHAFLGGRITFPRIAEIIDIALQRVPISEASSYEAVERADALAREEAKKAVYGE